MRSVTSLVPLAALVASAATGSSSDNTAVCCTKLREAFPAQVVSADGADFDAWNERWADTAELPASCIFRPLSAEDVSFAISTFTDFPGTGCQGYCSFSIKGGGHTPWAGANNVNGGVAIDLAYINQTIISEDRSYVSLGGGTIWKDAYLATNGSGIAFPGGRCPGTGVGGLTTGGGYSWFTGQVGFVTDSVLNFQVVLASGEIVNANKDENSDLFHALKGGNNNFGVVTRFDIAAFEHNQQVFGGLVIVPGSKSDEVLAAFQAFTDDSTGIDASAGLTIEYFIPNDGEPQILLWLVDTDDAGDHAALQPFFDMEPKLVNQVYRTSIVDYPTAIPPVSRVLMADVTFVNDLETIKAVYDITMDIRRTLSNVPGLTWDFQLEPLPRHVIEASNAKGGNVMGLEDVDEDLLILFLMPLWSDAAYDDTVYKAAEKWHRKVKKYTENNGKGHRFEFANYASYFQDPMASYGPENLQFLGEVSRKYDPTSLFQQAVKGGYKLTAALS